MTDLTLFDLEPDAPPRPAAPTCGWGAHCHHPEHADPYPRPAQVWATIPCHECGAPLNRYLRTGHWNLDAWDHLRAHAHTHRTIAMDGRLWIGHPERNH